MICLAMECLWPCSPRKRSCSAFNWPRCCGRIDAGLGCAGQGHRVRDFGIIAAAPARQGGGGLSLCLASVGVVNTLSIAAFTLVWTHSIEKVDWQGDWRITPNGLELGQARTKGSRAGME